MKRLLIILFALATVTAMAQPKYFYLALDYNAPMSNKNWIGDGSAKGIRLGYRAFVSDRFSAGIDVGSYAVNDYKPTTTIENESGAITTDYFNYVYAYTAVLSGQYNFLVGDGDMIFPYGGLGVGANYNEYVQYYNIYNNAAKAFGFLVRPEAGVLVRFGTRRSLGAMAAVHYDFSTNQTQEFNYKNFTTLGFQVGLIFMDL